MENQCISQTHTHTHIHTSLLPPATCTINVLSPIFFFNAPLIRAVELYYFFSLWNDLFPSLVVVWLKFWIHVHVQALQVVKFYFLFFYLRYLLFCWKGEGWNVFSYTEILNEEYLSILFLDTKMMQYYNFYISNLKNEI